VTKTEIQAEALRRAQTGQSTGNYVAILTGFVAKGLPMDEILPRENVYTYQAWLKLGRQVRKGEHGVRISTFVPTTRVERGADGTETKRDGKLCRAVSVFHVSQTDLVQGGAP
jgi:antirestriction protein ArdC